MRKLCFFAAGLCAGALLPAMATASTVANATILEIAIDPAYGNHVFIRLNVMPSSRPACATHDYWHYTLSFSGVAAKEMYAALLAAQMAGKTITTTGAGNCMEHATVESLRGFNVQS